MHNTHVIASKARQSPHGILLRRLPRHSVPRNDERGFTLVELSIVLVIIGLLIGGILAAQSMINTSKVQNVIRQYQQFDIAVANFQTRYNQLPGDSTLFPNQGNNNGQIDNSEPNYTWVHLSQGVGLKNSQGTDYQSIPGGPPFTVQLCPRTALDNPAENLCLFIVYENEGVGSKNYYRNNYGVDILKPADALALDTKSDDGLPSSGRILMTPFSNASCKNGTAYNSSLNAYKCSIAFELGAWTPNN